MSAFHWQFLITNIFSVSLQHHRSLGRVQSKEYYFVFTYIFFGILLLFFIKIIVFSFLNKVSNFCNRILTSQKLELVNWWNWWNCQWNCMFYVITCKFANTEKRTKKQKQAVKTILGYLLIAASKQLFCNTKPETAFNYSVNICISDLGCYDYQLCAKWNNVTK